MGMFSWIDVNGQQNITDSDDRIVLLIPKEHREAVSKMFDVVLGKNGIEGKYDCYGSVEGNGRRVDFYDAVSFINICCTTDEQYADMVDVVKTRTKNEVRKGTIECMDEIRRAYKEGEINSLPDIEKIVDTFKIGCFSEFRSIGIDLACYDEDNARLPYPIKVSADLNSVYENSYFSMGDPHQGFYPYEMKDRTRYAYNEWDWDDEPKYIEEEEYNEETGEYETVEVENPEYEDPHDRWMESDDYQKWESAGELEDIEEERQEILQKIRDEQRERHKEVTPELPRKEPPKPDYTLIGVDGNAFSIIGYTARCLKSEGLHDKVEKMREEATSGDYNRVIMVCDSYIDMANEAKHNRERNPVKKNKGIEIGD